VKRVIILISFMAVGFAGGVLWIKERGALPPAAGETSPNEPEAAGQTPASAQVSRDANGNAVIVISAKARQDLGFQVKQPVAYQMSPELKAYGKVLDPSPLALLVAELATAQAAYTASSNELSRLKTLEGQGNASARALQSAEAIAQRDHVAVRSVMERVALTWGRPILECADLPALVPSLANMDAAVVRLDLPLGESPKFQVAAARIAAVSDQSAEAGFLGLAPSVDPQMQGRGFLFLLKPNSLHLAAGESVTGYIRVPGQPLAGVIIPREAVVRTEGAGWVYVLNPAGDSFTRVQIALDRPTETGWFVTKGVSSRDSLVVAGAQQLLSFEVRSAGGGE
jgi:hypothetical protein